MKNIEQIRRENLALLIKEAGSVKELAAKVDRQYSQISQWKNASIDKKTGRPRVIQNDSARYLENCFGKPEGWMDVDRCALSESIENAGVTFVDVVDSKLSAGKGEIVLSRNSSRRLMFRQEYLVSKGGRSGKFLIFPVSGDSMVDAHIPDNSYVLIDQNQKEPISGCIYGLWIGKEIYVKELVKKEGDYWVARSHNSAITEDKRERKIDTEDSGIIGKVIWCGFDL